MSTSPAELFEVARTLAGLDKNEHTCRAIANRSYYAAFHGAKIFHEKLPSPGSVGNARGSHEQLIACLDNPTIARGDSYWISKGLSKSLRLALATRVIADYELNKDLSETDSDIVLKQCEEILKRSGHI